LTLIEYGNSSQVIIVRNIMILIFGLGKSMSALDRKQPFAILPIYTTFIAMHILQYYTASQADKARIIALAELLGCEYRTVENIIAVQVDDDETLDR
jgi:hypothetical protein